jgi:hypothetical protein
MTPKARGQHAPAPRLAGTGQLADDLYLIAHHERTGKPLLGPVSEVGVRSSGRPSWVVLGG